VEEEMSDIKGAGRDQASMPDPDHPAKPDGPGELHKRSWKYVGRKVMREFSEDQCTDQAAGLTYYAVLALFPAILALMSLVGLFMDPQDAVDKAVEVLNPLVAQSTLDTITPVIRQLASSQSAGLTLIIGLAGALWSASGYVGAFGRAMNRVYEIDEGRPFWKLRPLMLVITLVAVTLSALVLVMLVVSGPLAQTIGNAVGLGSAALTAWQWAKWPVLLVMVMLAVALLYYATPNVKQPKFKWISVGAACAIVIWVIASAAFAFYVANFGNYNKTYGSLAGVIVALLWLWITNLALLLGAEIDSELERGRQLQAGIPAEEELQLPARDTRNIEKAREKEQKDIEMGRAIREQADPEGDVANQYDGSHDAPTDSSRGRK
jgi:membrane protein